MIDGGRTQVLLSYHEMNVTAKGKGSNTSFLKKQNVTEVKAAVRLYSGPKSQSFYCEENKAFVFLLGKNLQLCISNSFSVEKNWKERRKSGWKERKEQSRR